MHNGPQSALIEWHRSFEISKNQVLTLETLGKMKIKHCQEPIGNNMLDTFFLIQMYTKWFSSSYCAPFDLQNNFIPFCFVALRLNRISSKLVRKWLIRLIKYSYSIIRSRFLVLISNWILDNLCITINGMYDSMDKIYGGDWTMLNSYKCLNIKR